MESKIIPETIHVIINPDGITAKEVNPLGAEPSLEGVFEEPKWEGRSVDEMPFGKLLDRDRWSNWCKWRKTEEYLRTFSITSVNVIAGFNNEDVIRAHIKSLKTPELEIVPGKKYKAEILETGAIHIF